jgi:lysophospholipase L1-like esterase
MMSLSATVAADNPEIFLCPDKAACNPDYILQKLGILSDWAKPCIDSAGQCQAEEPEIVFVLLGINDMCFDTYMSKETVDIMLNRYEDRLTELLGRTRGRAAIISTFPSFVYSQSERPCMTSGGYEFSFFNQNMLMPLYDRQKAMADANRYGFIDIWDQFEPEDGSLYYDGWHPNAQGHWLIARQILVYLGEEDVPQVMPEYLRLV